MTEKIPEPKAGDPCPNCGDQFVEHREPTELERKRAEDREFAVPYPARVDSAPAQQRAELGALYECRGCGYRTRIKSSDADAATDAPSARSSRSRAKASTASD